MNINDRISSSGMDIVTALHERGYQPYFVGGCVRDVVSGDTPHDEDIAVNASPDNIKRTLSHLDGDFIDKGGEKFGTVVFRDTKGVEYEVTTFRKDGEYSDGRHPDTVIFANTIQDDLSRRDFTMNAMAYSPFHGLVDPFGGERDIQDKVIRTVGDPDERFREDPLRMMRGVRFAVNRGYEIEKETLSSMQKNAEKLDSVSRERICSEFRKMFSAERVGNTHLLHDSGVLKVISPELDRMFSCEQNNPYHITDVGHHTCMVIENCHSYETRLAALFHDVGKPDTKAVNSKGYDSFYGHPTKSAEMTKGIMKELRFTKDEINRTAALVRDHDALKGIAEAKRPNKSIRNFFMEHQKRDDKYFSQLIELKRADYAGQNREINREMRTRELDLIEKGFNRIIENHLPRTYKDLAVNGHDMIKLGIEPKMIPEIQHELLRTVMDHPEYNTFEELSQRVPGINECLSK